MPWTEEQYRKASELADSSGVDDQTRTNLRVKMKEYESSLNSVNKTPNGTLITDAIHHLPKEVNFRPIDRSDVLDAAVDAGNVKYVFEPSVDFVKNQLISDENLRKHLGISNWTPEQLADLKEEDTPYSAYTDYKWKEAIEKAEADAKEGKNNHLIRYSKLGWGDDLARKSAGALIRGAGALTLGLDDAALGIPGYLASHALQVTGIEQNAVKELNEAKDTYTHGATKPLRIAGHIIGSIGSLAGKIGTGIASKLGYEGAKGLEKAAISTIGGAAGAAAETAGSRAVRSASDVAQGQNPDLSSIPEEVLSSAATGAILAPALEGIGAIAGKAATRFRQSKSGRDLATAEKAGVTTDPIRGVKVPESIQSNLDNQTLGQGNAADIAASKIAPQISDRLTEEHENLRKVVSGKIEAYHASPEGQETFSTAPVVDTLMNSLRRGFQKKVLTPGEVHVEPRQAASLRVRIRNLTRDRKLVTSEEADTLKNQYPDALVFDKNEYDNLLTGKTKSKALSKYAPETASTPEELNQTLNKLGFEAVGSDSTVKSAEILHGGLKDFFGKTPNDSELKSLLAVDALPGATGKLLYDGSNIRYHATTPDGINIYRSFYKESYKGGKGSVNVIHSIFSMPENMQNSGIGSRVLQNQLASYERLGVKKIELDAVNIGKYAWSRMGFKAPDDVVEATREAYKKFIFKKYKTTVPYKRIDKMKSLKEIADSRFGKEFLTSDTLPWLTQLEMDVGSKEFNNLKNYLSNKTGSISDLDLIDRAINKTEFRAKTDEIKEKGPPKDKVFILPQKVNSQGIEVLERAIQDDLNYNKSGEAKDDVVLKNVQRALKQVRDNFKPNELTPDKAILDDGSVVTGYSALQRKNHELFESQSAKEQSAGRTPEAVHKKIAAYTGSEQGKMLEEKRLQEVAEEMGLRRELQEVAATKVIPQLRAKSSIGGALQHSLRNPFHSPGAIMDFMAMRMDPMVRAMGGVVTSPYANPSRLDKLGRELFRTQGPDVAARTGAIVNHERRK